MSLVPFKITKDLKYIDYLNTKTMTVYVHTPVDKFFEGKEKLIYLLKYIPVEGTDEKLCLSNKGHEYGTLSVDTGLNFRLHEKDTNETFKNVVGKAVKTFGVENHTELLQFVKKQNTSIQSKKYKGLLMQHLNDSIVKSLIIGDTQKLLLPDFGVEINYNNSEYRRCIKVYDYGQPERKGVIESGTNNNRYSYSECQKVILARQVKKSGIYYQVRTTQGIEAYRLEQIFESEETFVGVQKIKKRIRIEDMNDVYEYDMDMVYDAYNSRKIINTEKSNSLKLLGIEYEEKMTTQGHLLKLSTTGSKVLIPENCTRILADSIFLNKHNTLLIVPESVKRVDNGAMRLVNCLNEIEIDFTNASSNDVIVNMLMECKHNFRLVCIKVNSLSVDLAVSMFREFLVLGSCKLEVNTINKIQLSDIRSIIGNFINHYFYGLITKEDLGLRVKKYYTRRWKSLSEMLNYLVDTDSCTLEAAKYIKKAIEHMNNKYLNI